MPYLNLDDEFVEHPKVDALTDGAFRLHVAALTYCAKHTTDGVVPGTRVTRLKPTYRPRELVELVAAGVWHHGGEGCGTDTCLKGDAGDYVIHDYLQWNRSRAWWAKRRATEAARVARWRAQRRTEPLE